MSKKKHHMDYTLLSRSGNDKVNIMFSSHYQGTQVAWKATIMTLKRYLKDTLDPDYKMQKKLSVRQFIDIPEDCKSDYCNIIIGLNLDKIDESAIIKTIIMINNYKNLRPGRHEFGDVLSPDTDANFN